MMHRAAYESFNNPIRGLKKVVLKRDLEIEKFFVFVLSLET